MRKKRIFKVFFGLLLGAFIFGFFMLNTLNSAKAAYYFVGDDIWVNERETKNIIPDVVDTPDFGCPGWGDTREYEIVEGNAIRYKDKNRDLGSSADNDPGKEFRFIITGDRLKYFISYKLTMNISAQFYHQAAAKTEVGFKVSFFQRVGNSDFRNFISADKYSCNINKNNSTVSWDVILPYRADYVIVDFFDHGSLLGRGFVRNPQISFRYDELITVNWNYGIQFKNNQTKQNTDTLLIGQDVTVSFVTDFRLKNIELDLKIGKNILHLKGDIRNNSKYGYLNLCELTFKVPDYDIGSNIKEKIQVAKLVVDPEDGFHKPYNYHPDFLNVNECYYYREAETVFVTLYGPDGKTFKYEVPFGGDKTIVVPQIPGYRLQNNLIFIDEPYKDTPYKVDFDGWDHYIELKDLRRSISFTIKPYTLQYRMTFYDREDRERSYLYHYKDPLLETYPIPKPRRAYDFLGYYDYDGNKIIDENGHPVAEDKRYLFTDDIDLVARWNGLPYNCTIKGEKDVTEVWQRNRKMPRRVEVPTKTGYDFGGYYAIEEGKECFYYDKYGYSYYLYYEETYDLVLYPKWKLKEISINIENGNGDADQTITVKYQEVLPDLEQIPLRPGYTYGGHFDYSNPEAPVEYYNALGKGKTIIVEEDITIVAKWIPISYEITLVNPEGWDGLRALTIKTDELINLTKLPVKKGYTFLGYYLEPDGKGAMIVDSKGKGIRPYDLLEDKTLYLHSKVNSYNFVVDNENGEDAFSLPYVFGTDVNPLEVPVKNGYTFLGYFSEANGQGTKYFDELGNSVFGTYVDGNDVNLYANWSKNSYKLTINQGKDLETLNLNVLMDSAYPEVNKPSKLGYIFKGFYTEENGKGVEIYNNEAKALVNFTYAADTTLYGLWVPVNINLTFDMQGGSKGTTEIATEYDKALPKITIPVKAGYAFAGYYTEASGKGVKYYDEAGNGLRLMDLPEATTLYAHYTPLLIKITLYDNKFIEVYYLANLPEAIDIPAKAGYTFKGYYTEENGSGTEIYDALGKVTSANTCTFTENTNLFVKWEANTYQVIFNSNKPEITEGEIVGETLAQAHTYDTPLKLTKNGFTLVGYNFKGWALEPTGEVKFTDEKEVLNLIESGEVTLYAVWEAITYTIKFNPGNNPSKGISEFEGTMQDVTLKYDQKFQLKYPDFRLKGCQMRDWNNGSGKTFALGEEIVNLTAEDNSTYNLYARWVVMAQKLVFDTKGGTPVTRRSVLFGDTLNDSLGNGGSDKFINHLPKRYGYKFMGFYEDEGYTHYYIAQDGTDTRSGRTRIDWEGTKTVYAKWKALDYKLVLRSPQSNYTYEDYINFENLTLPILENDYLDHRFMGWSSVPDQKEGTFKGGIKLEAFPVIDESKTGTIPETSDPYSGTITLYAAWKYNYYKVSYVNGSKELTSLSYQYDNSVTLKSLSDFTELEVPVGMYLAGWSPYRDSINPIYLPGQVVELGLSNDLDVTLYAVFKEIEKYQVIYNVNGGINPPVDNNKYLPGSEFKISLNIPINQTYTFKGWTTDPYSSVIEFPYENDSFTVGEGQMVEGGITLYAVWEEKIDIAGALNKINSDIKDLNARINIINSEITLNKENLEALKQVVAAAQADIESLRNIVALDIDLQSAVMELKNLIATADKTLEDRIIALEAKVEEFIKKFELMDSIVEGFEVNIISATLAVENAQTSIDALESSYITSVELDALKENLLTTINEANQALEAKIKLLEDGLAKANQDLAGLKTTDDAFTLSLKTLTERLAVAEKTLAAIDLTKYPTALAVNTLVSETKTALEAKIKTLEDSLGMATKEIESLKTTDEGFTEGIKTLTERLTIAEKALEAIDPTAWPTVEAVNKLVNEANQALEAKIKTLEDNLTKAITELAGLKTTDEGFTASIKTLTEGLDVAKKAIEAIDLTKYPTAEAVNKAITEANQALEAKIKSIEDSLTAATTTIEGLKTTDTKLATDIKTLTVGLKAAEEAIKAIDPEKFPTIENVNSAIEEANKAINTKISEIEADLTKANTEIAGLKAQDEDVLNKIADLTKSLEQITLTVNSLNAKDLELEEKINQINEEIKNIKTSLTDSIAKLKAELDGKIDDLNNKFDGLENKDKKKTNTAAIVATSTSSFVLLIAAFGLAYFKRRH